MRPFSHVHADQEHRPAEDIQTRVSASERESAVTARAAASSKEMPDQQASDSWSKPPWMVQNMDAQHQQVSAGC